MAEENQHEALRSQQSRVLEHGSVWLNKEFTSTAPRFRIKRSGIRLSLPDVIWIVILSVVLTLAAFFIFLPLSWLMPTYIQPYLLGPVFGLPAGWLLGRKVAKASPYRNSTGEGIGSYLYVQVDSKSYLLKRIFGRTVATSRYESQAGPRKAIVLCVEWIGTSRASIMPRYDADTKYKNKKAPVVEVEFIDQTKPANWIAQKKRFRQEGF